ncbi:MAG: hypothetical protein RLZZ283_46 [Candidatus Parcubacteria bacterium]
MRQKPRGPAESVGDDRAELEVVEQAKAVEVIKAMPKAPPAESRVDSGPVEPPEEPGVQDQEQKALLEAEAALRELGEQVEQAEQKQARAGAPKSWRQQDAHADAGTRPDWAHPDRSRTTDTLAGGALAFDMFIASLVTASVATATALISFSAFIAAFPLFILGFGAFATWRLWKYMKNKR